jgi:uncharacterized membrane protein
MNAKPVWKSKILWANLIAIVVLLAQSELGYEISAEAQGGILAVINILLRLITKEPLDWGGTNNSDNDGSGTPVNQAGFARVITLLALFIIAAAMLSMIGCATTSGKTDSPQVFAGKTLLAIQSEIISTRDAIGVPCQQGYIPQAECQAMDSIYQQSKPAYDAAVDAAVIALASGKDTDISASNVKRAALESLAANIIKIAVTYGVQGGK